MKFEELYQAYKDMVYNLCLNYLQNKEEAEDAMQDIFVKVHKKLSSFEARASHKTWLYRLSINTCLDHIKAKKSKKRFGFMQSLFQQDSGELNTDISHFNHPGVILEQKEKLAGLFACINLLSDNQKTALILSKIEGKAQKEIAEIMELSPKAVESLIQRAKRNVKKCYAAKDL